MTMKRHNIITMKSRHILLVLAMLLLCGAGQMNARTYSGSQKIFVSIPDAWKTDNPKFYVYVWQSWDSGSAWISLTQAFGDLYVGTVPDGYWDRCLIARQNPAYTEPGWEDDKKWGQSKDLVINEDYNNYIHSFDYNTSPTWGYINPNYYHDGSETIYINLTPSNWPGFNNDFDVSSYVFVYYDLPNPKRSTWVRASMLKNNLLQVNVPQGLWENLIVTRQYSTTPAWDHLWGINDTERENNKSKIIPVYANQILHNFKPSSNTNDAVENYKFVPAPNEEIPSPTKESLWSATREDIHVCESAIIHNDLFTLTPLWNSAKDNYAKDETGAPIWWIWNHLTGQWDYVTNNWSQVDEVLEEGMFDANGDAYYFMWTYDGRETYRRFLHLQKTDCTVDCSITSFEIAVSAVNVHDSTYIVDGLVAFTEAAGDLIAQCGDITTTITSPTSPATFTLTGLKADGADHEIQVYFSSNASCSDSKTITAPLPTTGLKEHASTISPYYTPAQATYRHGQSVVLTNNAAATAAWDWKNLQGITLKSGVVGADNTYTPATYGFDTTIVVYYSEYNPVETNIGNLMGNSSYETLETDAWYTATSEYTYTDWWTASNSKSNVYEYETSPGVKPYDSKNKLWGITDNAYRFWRRYANLNAHQGSYYAVFDGDDQQRIAWQASTKEHTNLKVLQGTTYIFSFWVANINNFGELQTKDTSNCAILQFKIRCKRKDTGSWVEAYLGDSTNMNKHEYRDNLWHQNSATFSTLQTFGEDFDADSVIISVVDKNNSGMRIGNDFALDDISFRAITTASRTVRARDKFEVRIVEPETSPVNMQVDWLTKPQCGKDTCTMRISFRYPNITTHDIKLTLEDLTPEGYGTLVSNVTLSKTPIAGNPDSTDYIGIFTSGSFSGATMNSKVKADSKAHNFRVKLTVKDSHDVDHGGTITKSGSAPGIPSLSVSSTTITPSACNTTTYSVVITGIEYTAFSGTQLKCYVDENISSKRQTYDITYSTTPATITSTTISGLPADGKSHTLYVTTGDSHDCDYSTTFTAPKGNTLTAFNASTIDTDCDATTYRLRAGWTVSKSAEVGSLYDVLVIQVGDATPQEIAITDANASDGSVELPNDLIVGAAHPTITAYLKERGSSCAYTPSPTYSEPVVPNITIGSLTLKDTICNSATYTAEWDVTYINQRGTMKAWLDDDTEHLATITGYSENTTTAQHAIISFTDLIADGSSHVLHVKCDGARSCERVTSPFKAPIRPVFTSATLSKTTPTFGETTYDVTIGANISNAKGKKLYIKSVDIVPALSWDTTLTATDAASVSHTFKNITTDNGVSHSFRIYFDELKHCAETLVYTSPDQREFQSLDVTNVSAVNCDGQYTFTFKAIAAEISGTLTITDNGTTVYSAAHNTTGSNPHTITATVTNLTAPATATEHIIRAQFAGQTYTRTDTIADYTAPVAPTIETLSETHGEKDCNGNITFRITIPFTNQSTDLVLLDENNANIATIPAAEIIGQSGYTYDWTFGADGVAHKVKAYFVGREDCESPYLNLPAIAAASWHITITDTDTLCDGQYRNHYHITWNDAVVGDFKFQGTATGSSLRTIAKTEYEFDTISPYFPQGNGNQTWAQAWFQEECKQDVKTNAVSVPVINSVAATPTTPLFGVVTYNVTVSATYSNASGRSITIRSTDLTPEQSWSGSVDASGSVSHTFENITTDNGVKHHFEVFFNDFSSCRNTAEYTSPDQREFQSLTVGTPSDVNCDGTFIIPFTITAAEISGTLSIKDGSTTVYSATHDTRSPASREINGITLPISADGLSHTLHAEFVGQTYKQTDTDVTFTAPVTPTLGHNVLSTPSVDCSGEVTQPIVFTYSNQTGNLVIEQPRGAGLTTVANGTLPTGSYTYHRTVPADGRKDTVIAYFSNRTACKDTIVFTAPTAGMWSAAHHLSLPDCNGRYTDSLIVTWNEAKTGDLKVYNMSDTELKSKPHATLSDTILFSDLITYDGIGEQELCKIAFSGDLSCKTTIKVTPPVFRSITATHKGFSNVDCNGRVKDTIDFVITNPTGDLVITKQNGVLLHNAATIGSTYRYVVDTIVPIGGGSMTLKYGLSEGLNCTKEYTVTLPDRPTITSVTASSPSATMLFCGETYSENITVQFLQGAGHRLYVEYTDDSDIKTAEVVPSPGETEAHITLTGLKDIGGEVRIVKAYFEDYETCTPEHSASYTTPAKKSITALTAVANSPACGETMFIVSGTVTANVAGESIVVSDGNGHYTTVISTNGSTDYTITGFTTSGSITAMFADKTCSKTSPVGFTAPDLKPNPAITLNPVASQCYPADEVAVGYSTTGTQIRYRVVQGATEKQAETPVAVDGTNSFNINTNGWTAGTYTIHAEAVSDQGCVTTATPQSFTINPQPMVSDLAVTSECKGSLKAHITFATTDATQYQYIIVGKTAWSAKAAIPAAGFDIDISSYDAGTYTLKLVAHSASCISDTATTTFEVYPKPELSFDAIADNCYPTASVEVTYNHTNTKSFKYIVKKGSTTKQGATEVTVDADKRFTINTADWEAGTYTITATATTEHNCTAETEPQTFTILPKPEVKNLSVAGECEGSTTAHATFATTDATQYQYIIVGKTAWSAKAAIPAAGFDIDISSYDAGTYTLKLVAHSASCISDTATTTFEVYPKPELSFDAIADNCYPTASVEVTYNHTNTKSFKYIVKKGSTTKQGATEVTVDADKRFTINTADWEAGTYTITATATAEHNCTAETEPQTFTLKPEPTVDIVSISNLCQGAGYINVNYTSSNATKLKFSVVGTAISGQGTAQSDGSISIDVSSLAAGTYTLSLTASTEQCQSTAATKTFVIYPIPAVTINQPTPIHEGVSCLNVTLQLTDADTYDYRFIDKDGVTQLDAANDIAATTTTITLTTTTLEEGTYHLYVKPYSVTCKGIEKHVDIVVNNKPSIVFTRPDTVCVGTSAVTIAYGASSDADQLTYSIRRGTTTVVSEQTISLAATPTSLTINTEGMAFGTYTLSGYVTSALGVKGDLSEVNFTLLAPPAVTISQPMAYAGCEETYSATISITLNNAAGRTIYATYTDDGNNHTSSVATTAGQTTAEITLLALKDKGLSGHMVNVYAAGFEDCGVNATYDEPLINAITPNFSVNVSPAACGDPAYTLSGTVSYNSVKGNLIVKYDDTHLTTITSPAAGASNFIIENMTAVGTDMVLTAYFSDAVGCAVQSAAFSSPTVPTMTTGTVSIQDTLCGEGSYTLVVPVTYTYQHGKMHVWVDEDSKQEVTATTGFAPSSDGYLADHETPRTTSVVIGGLKGDGKVHTLNIEFTGSGACSMTGIGGVNYVAPLLPVINGISVATTKPTADNLTYSATVSVDYTNYSDDLSNGELTIRSTDLGAGQLSYSESVTGIGTLVHTFTGIAVEDGKTLHFEAFFNKRSQCRDTIAYRTSGTWSYSRSHSVPDCDGLYSDTLRFTWDDNMLGDFTLNGNAGALTPNVSIAHADKSYTYIVSGLNTADNGHSLCTVSFSGVAGSDSLIEQVAPTLPVMTITHERQGEVTQDGKYSVILHFSLSGQSGDLVVTGPDGSTRTITDVGTSADMTFSGLTANGQQQTFTASLTKGWNCEKTYSIDAPPFEEIVFATRQFADMRCRDEEYTMQLYVKTRNAQEDIIISADGTVLSRIAVSHPYSGTKFFRHNITRPYVEGGKDSIAVYFASYPSYITSLVYDMPERPACDEMFDTICAGEHYAAHAISFTTPAVACDIDTLSADTNIHIHVVEAPVITLSTTDVVCDSATSLTVPYTLVGEADYYTVVIGEHSVTVNGLLSANGEIALPLPTGIAAGRYKAQLTFGLSSVSCSTNASIDFEVAASGLLYSKWSDVLFVADRDSVFSSYRWYENGTLLAGETNQRLYRAGGLSGTYYCEITTRDGFTFLTCETAFADVPRSADRQQNVTPSVVGRGMPMQVMRNNSSDAVIRLYSATGQLMQTINSAEENVQIDAPVSVGLFIITIEDKQSTWQQKIIVK